MVKWSRPAKQDLKTIHDFVAKDSKHYAQMVVREIVAKSEDLKEFPFQGRIVPEVGSRNIREVIVYSYRLIYQVCQSDIEILTLLHSKRNFPEDIAEHD